MGLGLLIRHFQEQEIGQLFHVVAIGHTIVPENVAVVPETGYDCWASLVMGKLHYIFRRPT